MSERQAGVVTRYLLGDLSETEEEAFEREYFRSDEAFAELLDAESQLIDEYVEDRLGPAERARFEERFLASPDRRQRVELALSLAGMPAAPARRGRTSAPVRWLGWAAAALMALAAGWAALQLRSVQDELERARAAGSEIGQREAHLRRALADQGARVERLAGELRQLQEHLQSLQPAARAVSVLLRTGLQRDLARSPEVAVSSATPRVLVQAVVPDTAYASYQAAVETVDGRVLLTQGPLALIRLAAGPAVQFWLDPRPLPTGHYVVTLRGTDGAGRSEEVAVYTFRLRRRD